MRHSLINKFRTIFNPNPVPDLNLAGLVKYWSINSAGKAVSSVMLTPDEHMDVVLDFLRTGRNRTPYLLGVLLKPEVLAKKEPVDVIGIKLLPGAFYSLFGVPAHLFLGKKCLLKSAIGSKAGCFDEVFALKTLKQRVKRLDSILLNLAKTKKPIPSVITHALTDIYASNGRIKVDSMAKAIGWTRYRFTTVFNKWIGANPRLFCKHLCFMEAVKALDAGHSMEHVIAKFGYSDQAHFIRFFKHRMGWTPRMRFMPGRYLKPL